jgi:opacity protein-like surface antigen
MTTLSRLLFGLAFLSMTPGALAAGRTRKSADPPTPRHDADEDVPAREETRPSDDRESGFALGARVGYAIPNGTLAKDQLLQGRNDLSKFASGMFPVIADIGYRFSPRFYLGGYFQYGFLSTSGELCAGATGCSSSGSDLRMGASVRFNASPYARFDPWVGAGVGYEILSLSISEGATTTDATVRGFEFVNLQVGGDFHVLPNLAIGPLVSLAVGQYGSYDISRNGSSSTSGDFSQTGLHEWLIVGGRIEYTP